jgi:hypothetical protein
LTVSPSHLIIHGGSFRLPKTFVETTFETELRHALLLLDHGGDFEQAVGVSDFADTWRVTTPDDNSILSLLDNLEVIGDDGAYFVVVREEVGSIPKMAGSLGATVLSVKVGSLGDES